MSTWFGVALAPVDAHEPSDDASESPWGGGTTITLPPVPDVVPVLPPPAPLVTPEPPVEDGGSPRGALTSPDEHPSNNGTNKGRNAPRQTRIRDLHRTALNGYPWTPKTRQRRVVRLPEGLTTWLPWIRPYQMSTPRRLV